MFHLAVLACPSFSFLEQLQDLISSSEFQSIKNLVVNKEPSCMFGKYVTPPGHEQLEVHSGSWYNRTYDKLITNPKLEVLMPPIIFYIDKTGTDVMQRFPLEPLMFTTTLLKREIRETASSWRHLGFVPPCDDAAATAESATKPKLFAKSWKFLYLYANVSRMHNFLPLYPSPMSEAATCKFLRCIQDGMRCISKEPAFCDDW
jgi:hypothetical protein